MDNNDIVSILDRDAPRSTVTTVTENNISDPIIQIIVIIIFILFFGWMLYLLISSGFKSSYTPTSASGTGSVVLDNGTSFIQCSPGQCVTNIFTGAKTCPTEDIAIYANPTQEVCNPRHSCTNPLTPFALLSDGSTNFYGICEPGVECSCLRIPQCAQYILSVFTTSNGNPYQNFNGQRITFPQESTYVNNISGLPTTNPPIQYNTSTTFCAAPLSWLPLSNPGCNFTTGSSISYDELLICMGLPNQCNGSLGNPCLQGTLAFITDNPDTFTQSDINTTQLACVRGEPCPCGFVSLFDTNYGAIVCRQPPP